ncbi:hypothetical protein RR46_08877 [Papilio xuthus]|uniref:Uncharacterized protein n=1 Tax=Papilio xuthus TaxID=66420 RepID=A0A194PR32_PAPXU|nr:hypothetical protein RR46_08877 [Papilio xuthus]
MLKLVTASVYKLPSASQQRHTARRPSQAHQVSSQPKAALVLARSFLVTAALPLRASPLAFTPQIQVTRPTQQIRQQNQILKMLYGTLIHFGCKELE